MKYIRNVKTGEVRRLPEAEAEALCRGGEWRFTSAYELKRMRVQALRQTG